MRTHWITNRYTYNGDNGGVGLHRLDGPDLPGGAVILRFVCEVEEAVQAAGSATVSIGTETAGTAVIKALTGKASYSAGAKITGAPATATVVAAGGERVTMSVAVDTLINGEFAVHTEVLHDS